MSDISQSVSRPRRQTVAALQPLAVSPKDAGRMLGIGKTTLFRLLKAGELKSYTDGSRKSRRILVSSIHDFVERRLAESD